MRDFHQCRGGDGSHRGLRDYTTSLQSRDKLAGWMYTDAFAYPYRNGYDNSYEFANTHTYSHRCCYRYEYSDDNGYEYNYKYAYKHTYCYPHSFSNCNQYSDQ